MTRELVEKCNKWEQQLRWAWKSNFVHMSNTEFSEVHRLYVESGRNPLTASQMVCNTCRLRALSELAQDFFTSRDKYLKEDREKEKEEQEKASKTNNTETTKTTNNKTGRPRKIKTE